MSSKSTEPIRADVEKMLRKAFPGGVMAPALDIQKSHFAGVFPRLKRKLFQLDGATAAYERDPLGGPGWKAGAGRLKPSRRPADPDGRPASYYVFFFAATSEECRVGDGTLKVGYCVALSVMAPAALVVLNHIEEDEFASSIPDIVPERVEDSAGDPREIGEFCREVLSEEGLTALERLREDLVATVEGFGFLVLPEDEQKKLIPWLEVPAMPFARPTHFSVRDALFFWAG